MVRPDLQRKGIGTNLLREIEKICPHRRYELFTSSKSENNIRLYEKSGYSIFKKLTISDNLTFVYFEKNI
jgi:ribosomal protein S18 acetylase RimI-like enzyme